MDVYIYIYIYIYMHTYICKRQIAFRVHFFIDTMQNLSNAGLAMEIPQRILCCSEELTLCQTNEDLVTFQVHHQKQIQELICNGHLLEKFY